MNNNKRNKNKNQMSDNEFNLSRNTINKRIKWKQRFKITILLRIELPMKICVPFVCKNLKQDKQYND